MPGKGKRELKDRVKISRVGQESWVNAGRKQHRPGIQQVLNTYSLGK